MARVTKNYMLEIGAAVLVVGLIFAVLSYAHRFMDAPSWLGFYSGALAAIPGAEPEGYNLWIIILSTLAVITGAFYFGEQITLRRRFERLISTPKKSEFASRRKTLEQLSSRLPDGYRTRVRAKEAEFKSLR